MMGSRLRELAVLSALTFSALACATRRPDDSPRAGPYPELPPSPRVPYVVPATAYAALASPLGVIPSIALYDGPATTQHLSMVPFAVNGFAANGWTCVHFEANEHPIADYELICPIHPYFLVQGDNAVGLASADTNWVATRWNYLDGVGNEELARGPGGIAGVFTSDAPIPRWSWVAGVAIVEDDASRKGLWAEVLAFHAALEGMRPGGTRGSSDRDRFFAGVRGTTAEFIRASELRGKPFTFLDELRAAAEGEPFGGRPANSVMLTRIDSGAMEVFAGGTLARIAAPDGAGIVAFDSTYGDGGFGAPGGTIVSAELWYRQDADAHWVLDAVVPVESTSTTRGADDNIGDHEQQFGYTSF